MTTRFSSILPYKDIIQILLLRVKAATLNDILFASQNVLFRLLFLKILSLNYDCHSSKITLAYSL